MAIVDTLKPFLFSILLICGGIVSIGISAWQFQIHDNGIQFTDLVTGDLISFKHVCNNFPYNWMRPFQMKIDDYDDAYCGFSEPNTSYRLALACTTVIGGALLIFFRNAEETKLVTYWGLFCVSILWYAASVADIIAVIQGTRGCVEGIEKYTSYVKCDSSKYGITIAVDIMMSVLLCLCWVLAGRESGDPKFSIPVATTTRASASASAPPTSALDRF